MRLLRFDRMAIFVTNDPLVQLCVNRDRVETGTGYEDTFERCNLNPVMISACVY